MLFLTLNQEVSMTKKMWKVLMSAYRDVLWDEHPHVAALRAAVIAADNGVTAGFALRHMQKLQRVKEDADALFRARPDWGARRTRPKWLRGMESRRLWLPKLKAGGYHPRYVPARAKVYTVEPQWEGPLPEAVEAE